MKKGTLLLLLASTIILFAACGGESSNTANSKLGKLEVKIPNELKDNKEVVKFVEGMAEVSDEYALMIDEILEDAGDFIGKETEELSMMEQIKLVQITSEVAIKSVKIFEKWGNYIEQRVNIEEQLTDDEIKALEIVLERFEKRMEQIEEKYSDLFENESE